MKRTVIALLAAITLCSCDSDLPESEITEYSDVPETTSQTYVFTGIPDIPSLQENTATGSGVDDDTEVTAAPDEEVTTAHETGTETAPEDVFSLDVPYYSQAGSPAGCELVCASMLLAYYDFHISSDELISEGYIETAPVDFVNDPERGLVMKSGDPNKVFIGDPNTPYGYGCYSGALAAGLRRYLDNEFFDAVDISGITLKDLCMEYIDFGEPVVIWASIDMEPTFTNDVNTWIIGDTGETFTWVSNEHCYVLVGYSEESFCFHDPQRGAYTLYPRDVAEARYREMGSQAVTIHPW